MIKSASIFLSCVRAWFTRLWTPPARPAVPAEALRVGWEQSRLCPPSVSAEALCEGWKPARAVSLDRRRMEGAQ